jgi:hypothetical protein
MEVVDQSHLYFRGNGQRTVLKSVADDAEGRIRIIEHAVRRRPALNGRKHEILLHLLDRLPALMRVHLFGASPDLVSNFSGDQSVSNMEVVDQSHLYFRANGQRRPRVGSSTRCGAFWPEWCASVLT